MHVKFNIQQNLSEFLESDGSLLESEVILRFCKTANIIFILCVQFPDLVCLSRLINVFKFWCEMKRITASPWILLHFATSRRRHWTLFILKGAWIFLILYLWSLLTSCHVQTVRQIDSNKGIWCLKKCFQKSYRCNW